MECQLVTIWNACRYYGFNNVPKIGSKEYKDKCRKYKCINGFAIGTINELVSYGLTFHVGKWDKEWIISNIPIECAIFKNELGTHSILIVKYENDRFLVTNYAKDRTHWMTYEQLHNIRINKFKPKAIKFLDKETYKYIKRQRYLNDKNSTIK